MSFSEKKILIVIGPQGSGNHLWAKIFGLHKSVYGWQKLQEQYWEAHHYEPFARARDDPTLLELPKNYSHFVTSCSIPYVYKGGHRVPPILEFCQEVERQKISPIIAVISRDKDIVKLQQERVRNNVTLNDAYRAIEEISEEHFINFLSYESLLMWKHRYLESLIEILKFPIDWTNPKVDEIIKENSNTKYLKDPGPQELDKVVKNGYRDSSNKLN